MTYRFL